MPDWASIIREHGPMAFQTAWHILGHVQDTEDAVQDALLEALRAFHRGEVRNWGGLLRHAATCRALDRLRQRRRTRVIPANAATRVVETPDNVAEARELAQWLRAVLADLPERQAQVFAMSCFSGLSNSEIAAAVDITAGAVAMALHQARATIAERHKSFAAAGGVREYERTR